MTFKVEISENEVMLSDPTALFWKISVQLSEHTARLHARAVGKACVFGDFRGTVVRIDDKHVTLQNEEKKENNWKHIWKELIWMIL